MKKLFFVLCFIFVFVGSSFAADKTVSLQWDYNSDAYYYVVYQSINSGDYAGAIETKVMSPILGATTSTVSITIDIILKNVVEEQTYYFVVKAFNDFGNSSDFSEEIFVKYGTKIPETPTGVKAWWKQLIAWMQNIFTATS